MGMTVGGCGVCSAPPPPCTGLSRMERVRPRLLPGVPVARKNSKQILNVHTYLI